MISRIAATRPGPGLDRVGRAELLGELELLGHDVDGDDRPGLLQDGAEQRREADAAEAEDGDALPGLDPGRVDRGADAGQDRAAEQGGELERQLRDRP